ncbi:MAG: PKD domain-containing protein [Gammaproteobacteria bacterium]
MSIPCCRHGASIRLSAVGFAAVLFAMASQASPVADVEASTLSGPAPLPVFFDATGTTDTDSAVDTFRELGYRFEFDDSSAGDWAYSGLPKNEQIGGPLAAHVFENPGVYVVRMTAMNQAGESGSATLTVEVQDPDEVFPGKATECISRNDDFTGCPEGARQRSDARRWPAIRSDTRYLLHAGQDFSRLGDIEAGNIEHVQFGAFGAGEKPLLESIRLQEGDPRRSGFTGNWIDHVTVMNLDVVDIKHETVGTNMLFFRNRLVRGGMIEFSRARVYYSRQARDLSGWRNSENIFFVENEIDRDFLGGGSSAITAEGRRLVVLGNSATRTPQHNVRLWQVSQAFVAHNRFDGRGRDMIRHCLKIHSHGLDPIITGDYADAEGVDQISSEIVIANNRCGGPDSTFQWMFEVGPQSTRYAEGIEKVIVEDNRFMAGPEHVRDIVFRGREMIDRGNWNETFDTTAVVQAHINNQLPEGWDGPYYFSRESVRSLFTQ